MNVPTIWWTFEYTQCIFGALQQKTEICDPTRVGYSARDLVISKHCRAENYLSNDITYVKIGQILIKVIYSLGYPFPLAGHNSVHLRQTTF